MVTAKRLPDSALDPVTRAFKTDAFLYFLGQELSRAIRYRNFFSLCLVGVDADSKDPARQPPEVMATIARALRAILRREDPIGLLPEGFGVILLYVHCELAPIIAERILSRLSEQAVRKTPRGVREGLSVSIGGATFPRDGQSEDALRIHAVRCLNEARRLGGNRAVYRVPDV